MAATKRNAMNIAEARQKIQTTQLVNRLTGHALGSVDMQPSQVTAALGLLKKSLPDLSATEMTMDGELTVTDGVDRPPAESRKEWLERKQREALGMVSAAGSAD